MDSSFFAEPILNSPYAYPACHAEVYNTERHLLYVACTRAREFLLVTSVRPASEFLDDLRGG
jgi:superfamily I DNA/RNA helicase